MAGADVWERFPLDPREEQHARLRASDRDRDVVNDVLGTAYADGQLSPAELDERSNAAAQSKTLGELPALIDDLVLPTAPTAGAVPQMRPAGRPLASGVHHDQAERRYRILRLVTLIVFLVPTLICWVVWGSLQLAGQGGDVVWPVFPMLGTSIPLLVTVIAHRDFVSGSEHRLERRELRRDLRRQRRDQPPPPPLPGAPSS